MRKRRINVLREFGIEPGSLDSHDAAIDCHSRTSAITRRQPMRSIPDELGRADAPPMGAWPRASPNADNEPALALVPNHVCIGVVGTRAVERQHERVRALLLCRCGKRGELAPCLERTTGTASDRGETSSSAILKPFRCPCVATPFSERGSRRSCRSDSNQADCRSSSLLKNAACLTRPPERRQRGAPTELAPSGETREARPG